MRGRPLHAGVRWVLAVVLLATVPACRASTSGTAVVGARPIRISASTASAPLTGNQLRFGTSARPDPSVVYQSDVVLVPNGADAIVSAGADGMNWTLRAAAPGVSDLAVGKILLATSYATGRVLALTRTGSTVSVLLGPVALTDLIRDADIGTSDPVPVTTALSVSTPTLPVFDSRAATGGAHKMLDLGALPTPPVPVPTLPNLPNLPSIPTGVPSTASVPPQNVNLPIPNYTGSTANVGPFGLQPYVNNDAVGVHLGYNGAAGRLQATLELGLTKPKVQFHLGITAGSLIDANLQLAAGGYLRYAFSGATTDSSGNFKVPTIQVPVNLVVTLGPIPVPIVLSFVQTFDVSMQLAGKAFLSASGVYALTGSIGFHYTKGSFGLDQLTGSTQKPITQSTTSLSVGINAIKFGYGIKASIGIGVPFLQAGVWYQIVGTLELVADGGPAPTSLKAGCAKASLEITGNYGIGYTIPKVVADVINIFLSLLKVKPISATAGPSGSHTIWKPAPAQFCLTR